MNHMRSNHSHKIRFEDIAYLQLNKWSAKILKNINKKNKKLDVSLPRNKMSHKSSENWICENELIVDLGGLNETKYRKHRRISHTRR